MCDTINYMTTPTPAPTATATVPMPFTHYVHSPQTHMDFTSATLVILGVVWIFVALAGAAARKRSGRGAK